MFASRPVAWPGGIFFIDSRVAGECDVAVAGARVYHPDNE
jgi:hypothetical protein